MTFSHADPRIQRGETAEMRKRLLQYVQSGNMNNTLISDICTSILAADVDPKEELLTLVALTLLLHELMLERIDIRTARIASPARASQSIQESTNGRLDSFIQSTIGYPQPLAPPRPSCPNSAQNSKSLLLTTNKGPRPTPERNFRNRLKVANFHPIS